jgi:hypothetical protein
MPGYRIPVASLNKQLPARVFHPFFLISSSVPSAQIVLPLMSASTPAENLTPHLLSPCEHRTKDITQMWPDNLLYIVRVIVVAAMFELVLPLHSE